MCHPGDCCPTSGDASVCGLSVRTKLVEVYRRTGFCPQFGGLWEHLSVRHHLEYYLVLIRMLARLGGWYKSSLPLAAELNKAFLTVLPNGGVAGIGGGGGGPDAAAARVFATRLEMLLAFVGQVAPQLFPPGVRPRPLQYRTCPQRSRNSEAFFCFSAANSLFRLSSWGWSWSSVCSDFASLVDFATIPETMLCSQWN